jgi:stage III sporulation protein AG
MDLKPILQNKWLLILGILGILCLLIGTFWNSGAHPTTAVLTSSPGSPGNTTHGDELANDAQPASITDLESQYDQRLTAMLKKIRGIHDVSVMVTLQSTEALQVANNVHKQTQTQTSGNQTTSSSVSEDDQVFTQRTEDGSSEPFVVQRMQPQVRGVLVVVQADDFYTAKAEIIDAIRNVLDVPAYKISVEPQ